MNPLTQATQLQPASVPVPVSLTDPQQMADALQAREILTRLAPYDITDRTATVAYDTSASAVVLRITTTQGIYALLMPPVGRAYPVHHNGRRIGALDARRVPAHTVSYVAVLLAAFLRDRAACAYAFDPRDQDQPQR